jgi:hypothetical protein
MRSSQRAIIAVPGHAIGRRRLSVPGGESSSSMSRPQQGARARYSVPVRSAVFPANAPRPPEEWRSRCRILLGERQEENLEEAMKSRQQNRRPKWHMGLSFMMNLI